jgi:arsenite methyltransferase
MVEQGSSIKDKVRERYGKIALAEDNNNSDCCCCCIPAANNNKDNNCNESLSPTQSSKLIGYDAKELDSIPTSSILGVGCRAPVQYANLQEGETVVDLGSGAGIDVFLAANKVKNSGRVIGIDMTDEMLEKGRKNAKENGYTNVEFRKGDIEKRIPVEGNCVDVVISNCVINLTTDKLSIFKEVHRILKTSGRMIISDLTTSKQPDIDSINSDKWCSCIDGALTKENYLDSIRKAGFKYPQILEEKLYAEGVDGRKITSVTIRATKYHR